MTYFKSVTQECMAVRLCVNALLPDQPVTWFTQHTHTYTNTHTHTHKNYYFFYNSEN